MADASRRVSVRISIDDAAKAQADFRRIGESGQQAFERISTSASLATRALTLLGPVLAGLSIGGLATMVRRSLDAVGGLGELAEAAGISTTALQGFQYAATQVGVSADELQRSLQALTRRIADAAEGESSASAAFARFGISLVDARGNVRSTESVLAELADRTSRIGDPLERAALATAFFGDRLGQRMIPFLAQGRDGLAGLLQEAMRFGAVADESLIAKADEAADRIAALESAFSQLARNLLATVAPALTSVAQAINRMMTGPSLAERRAQLEGERAALQRRLEELATGAAPSPPVRRDAIGRVLRESFREQARIDQAAELRAQLEAIEDELRAVEEAERRIAARVQEVFERPGVAPPRPPRDPARQARVAADANRELLEIERERARLIEQTNDAYETLQARLAQIADIATRAEAAGMPIDPERLLRAGEQAMQAYLRATGALEGETRRASDAARELGFTFSSAFEDAIIRGQSLRRVVEGLGQDLLRIATRRLITEPLAAAAQPVLDRAMGWIQSAIGGLFGGARAEGGPVMPGRMYLVGERGPELFLPEAAGRIVPAGGAGLVFSPTYNIDARGADAGMLPRLRAEMMAIAQASIAHLKAEVNRGGEAARIFGRR